MSFHRPHGGNVSPARLLHLRRDRYLFRGMLRVFGFSRVPPVFPWCHRKEKYEKSCRAALVQTLRLISRRGRRGPRRVGRNGNGGTPRADRSEKSLLDAPPQLHYTIFPNNGKWSPQYIGFFIFSDGVYQGFPVFFRVFPCVSPQAAPWADVSPPAVAADLPAVDALELFATF